MEFIPPKESFSGRVFPVTIGSKNQQTFGGENTLPFHSFEGEIPNRPLIAYEIQDIPPKNWPDTVKKAFKDVGDNPVQWARYCEEELKAKAIALRLIGTHPDSENLSSDDTAKTISDVLSTIKVPLIILGSNHAEKDSEVLVKASEAAKGYNCAIGKAQEANYKTIVAAAMANGHKLIAMSELDINLSKQLNILITQMGFEKERIITDPMCSALGYGLEYTYSVMERIRFAALSQNDAVMQPPMLGDVGMYVWKIKETQAPEDVLPHWGSLEERAILWEAITASSLLLAGSEFLIMRHPKAAELVERFIDELR